MGKLVKVLVAVGLIGVAIYLFMNPAKFSFDSGSNSGKPAVRPEEKVGVTTETVGN